MAITIYDTRAMVAALEQRKPPKSFLLDMFFSDVETSDTEYVDIDIIKRSRRMAAFVSPLKEGQPVEDEGYTTNSLKPAYIKNKFVLPANDAFQRQPGQTVYSPQSAEQREAAKLARRLADLQDMVIRREEWMAAQALTTGQIAVTGEGVNVTVDFSMQASHKPVLTTTARWNDSAPTILENLRTWKRLIAQDSGLMADIAVLGNDALDSFLADSSVQSLLDNRRINLGQVDPRDLPNGAQFIGTIEGLDVYNYSEWYESGGSEYLMLPADGVIIGSTRARTARHYGAIQDYDAGLQALRWFPKSWVTKDPSARHLMLQSAPLVVPHQIDAFVYADVQ